MITCKEYAKQRKEELKKEIEKFKYKKPTLTIVQVGDKFASNMYVSYKLKDCEEVGIKAKLAKLPSDVSIGELKETLNANFHQDGVIIQLPLPKHLNVKDVLHYISLCSDVDGFIPGSPHTPCTPKGIMSILKVNNIKLDGANAVVIGRSDLVGKPMAKLLLKENANVTICHSHTSRDDLKRYCLNADIIIAALGSPEFVTADMVKEGAVIVDVGTTRVPSDKTKSGFKLTGDVKFDEVADKCSYITPVPGGVGPMTIVSLMRNTLLAGKKCIY